MGDLKMLGDNPRPHTSVKALKPEKPSGSPKDSHWLSLGLSTNNGGIDGKCVLKIENTKITSHPSHKSLGLKKPLSETQRHSSTLWGNHWIIQWSIGTTPIRTTTTLWSPSQNTFDWWIKAT